MNLALFQENFDILRKSSGKWVDKRLVMMTAAQCSTLQKGNESLSRILNMYSIK